MIRSELRDIVAARNPHLYRRDVEKLIDTILGRIEEGLCDGRRVELRGFGTFSVRHRPARQGRNPRTGESVDVAQV